MPLGNVTGMTQIEREQVIYWLEQEIQSEVGGVGRVIPIIDFRHTMNHMPPQSRRLLTKLPRPSRRGFYGIQILVLIKAT